MKPKRKNQIPAFIPNQSGIRGENELAKNKENQKKLMLSNKNRKY